MIILICRMRMCYNCGCGMPNNDQEHPLNIKIAFNHALKCMVFCNSNLDITDKTFEKAAKSISQSVKQAKENTLNLLEEELKEEKNVESISPHLLNCLLRVQ